jgi:ribosomal protein S18 acetylase RimI-like enzyme
MDNNIIHLGDSLLSMIDQHLITHLELVSARAWPAQEKSRLEGWMLRANNGITWRANSVLPCFPLKDISLGNAIERAIEFYRSRGIVPAFKMTASSQPKELDAELDGRGFQCEMPTHLQTTKIRDLTKSAERYSVEIKEDMDRDWMRAYGLMGGFDKLALETRFEVIDRIDRPKRLAEVRTNGKIVGIGMSVVEDNLMGLFGIYTLSEYRKKGIGGAVSIALGRWGEQQGADTAYLQVEASNSLATSFYAKLGFETVYDYWYRILRE